MTMELGYLKTCPAIGLLAYLLCAVIVAADLYCPQGTYFKPSEGDNQPEKCVPCYPGFYQDQQNHRIRHCKHCSVYNLHDPQQILVEECTASHDIIVECVPGFYLDGIECKACTDCSLLGKFQGQACSGSSNTVCCDANAMVVRDGRCEFDPITCGPDQYLVSGETGQQNVCRPCPRDTDGPEPHSGSPKSDETPGDHPESPGPETIVIIIIVALVVVGVLVGVSRYVGNQRG